MPDNLKLKVNGFGSINEANLEINKINVVGGINSSGKSTVARLLYCYLKADVLNDEKYIRKLLMEKLEMIDGGQSLSPDISLSNLIEEYDYNFPQNDDVESLIKLLTQEKQVSYTSILRDLIVKEKLDLFKGYSKLHNSYFTSIFGNDFDKEQYSEGFIEVRSKMRDSKNVDKLNEDLNSILDEGNDYFNDYHVDNDYLDDDFYDEEFDQQNEMLYDIVLGFKLYVYKTKGSLNLFKDVFYIDSLSILDMLELINSEKKDANNIDVIYPKNHIKYLINSLRDESKLESIGFGVDTFYLLEDGDLESLGDFGKQNVDILKKIYNIINGSVSSGKNDVYYSFNDIYVDSVGTGNIASGIKQIGIIELLVSNGNLKDNSFLIIDEPEVNLHPDWQFKFAEILVMLAKDFNITIYINSHSPMFIEAIDALTEFYDMQDDVNYYLTEKYKDKYDFTKINSNELHKIYKSLGDIYDEINKLRIRKRLNDRG